ncbi:MAG: head-tail adaptor protein [Hyphomonadaceae bacterium]
MTDAIGALRARVKLQSPMRVADELGGAAIMWQDEGDVWAMIEALGASQSGAFDTAPSIASFRVTLNRRGDVRAGWRLGWGARRLRVVGVADEGAPRLRLHCEEEKL